MSYGYELVFRKDEYAHLDVIVYYLDKDCTVPRYTKLAAWEYLTTKDHPYWFGGSFLQAHINNSMDFAHFAKLVGMVQRNNLYAPSLVDLLAWLSRHTLVVYDVRLERVVTATAYQKSLTLNAYKITRNNDGRYLDDVLAYTEGDATIRFMQNCRDRYAANYGVTASPKNHPPLRQLPKIEAIVKYPETQI